MLPHTAAPAPAPAAAGHQLGCVRHRPGAAQAAAARGARVWRRRGLAHEGALQCVECLCAAVQLCVVRCACVCMEQCSVVSENAFCPRSATHATPRLAVRHLSALPPHRCCTQPPIVRFNLDFGKGLGGSYSAGAIKVGVGVRCGCSVSVGWEWNYRVRGALLVAFLRLPDRLCLYRTSSVPNFLCTALPLYRPAPRRPGWTRSFVRQWWACCCGRGASWCRSCPRTSPGRWTTCTCGTRPSYRRRLYRDRTAARVLACTGSARGGEVGVQRLFLGSGSLPPPLCAAATSAPLPCLFLLLHPRCTARLPTPLAGCLPGCRHKGALQVDVVEARNLPRMDTIGTSEWCTAVRSAACTAVSPVGGAAAVCGGTMLCSVVGLVEGAASP